MRGQRLGTLSNNMWSGGTPDSRGYKKTMDEIIKTCCKVVSDQLFQLLNCLEMAPPPARHLCVRSESAALVQTTKLTFKNILYQQLPSYTPSKARCGLVPSIQNTHRFWIKRKNWVNYVFWWSNLWSPGGTWTQNWIKKKKCKERLVPLWWSPRLQRTTTTRLASRVIISWPVFSHPLGSVRVTLALNEIKAAPRRVVIDEKWILALASKCPKVYTHSRAGISPVLKQESHYDVIAI